MASSSKTPTTIEITTETIVRAVLLTVVVLVALKLVGSVGHQLRLIVIAAFLALALNPMVTWVTVHLKSKSRVRATGVAYLTVVTLLMCFLFLVVPPFVHQTTDFVSDIPSTISDFEKQDSTLARVARRYNVDEQLSRLTNDFGSRLTRDVTGPIFNTANRIVGALISIITVLILTFMLLIEGPIWLERILTLQPAAKRAHRRDLATRMYRVVTGYVNGQVLVAAIGAAFALVALLIASSIFNASINAVAMAGIIFLFALIPMIGTFIGSTIVVLFCLFVSAPLALTMIIYFLVYQQIENATIQPYIQSRSNQLTPLTVFVAAMLGVGFGGLLGAIAAIPIAGCIRILLEDRLKNRLPSLAAIDES